MSAGQKAIWESGDYTGPNRPMMRATIQVLAVAIERGHKWNFADYIFGQTSVPKELPNIRSIKYDRHIHTDAATMTMTLYNTQPLPLGTAVVPDDFGNYTYDQPGYFTFNRGLTTFTNRWHHTTNEWQGLLAPDRVIRTYEGYGFDPLEIPELDPNQTLSGVWIIDKVEYTANGIINITARDGARLLIDSIIFPPIVPLSRYPLRYIANHPVANPPRVTTGTGWARPIYDADSGQPYASPPGTPNYPVHGHLPAQAFDADARTYWLSIGNGHPRADYAFEWVQGKYTSPKSIRHVQFQVWGGPYVAYISVFHAGAWRGAAVVPYNPENIVSAPNGANIRYVKRVTVQREQTITVDLGQTFSSVTKVRVCLTSLYNSGIGPYPYRGGIRNMTCATTVTTTTPGGTHTEGDFGDYSEIVKQFLAWGGFHWPKNHNQAKITRSDGYVYSAPAPSNDPAIGLSGDGRVWGDIETAGTGAVPGTVLDIQLFDKKPIMDGITYIKDILGFIFFVDETGAAVFRSPNIWKIGNFVGDAAPGPTYVTGTSNLITLDENKTLHSLQVTLSSHNQRERVFVANVSGKIGAVASGHYGPSGPFNSNLRRVAGWTDQFFSKTSECQRMADLISLRQLFTYRTDQVRIAGYSGIQIDDQVRILEGTTSEDFIHYVAGLSSEWDIETGEWWYSLDTHWLGEEPETNWAFNTTTDLSAETRLFLQAIGRI